MHRRYEGLNIPIEIVRTVVAIAETGSFSKAGNKLGLSQPAISTQIKRLQLLVGGAVFDRVSGGVTLTALGKLVLSQARKMLEANDQILSLGGTAHDSRSIRMGFSTLYIAAFFKIATAKPWDDRLGVHCAHSAELAKALSDGYLDVACLLNPPDEPGELMVDWQEDFVWVRNRDFILSHGTPIPIVSWPGSLADQPAIQALEKSGLAYRIAFTSADYHARLSAVAAGIGLMGLPERLVGESIVIARDYYLPPVMPMRAGIWVRSGAPMNKVGPIVELLKKLAPNEGRRRAA